MGLMNTAECKYLYKDISISNLESPLLNFLLVIKTFIEDFSCYVPEQGGQQTLKTLEDPEKPWILFALEKYPGKP